MRTLHTAPLLRLTHDNEPPPDQPAPGDDDALSDQPASGDDVLSGPAVPVSGGPLPAQPAPGDGGPLSGWAVLVDGARIEAVGPTGELTQAYPMVRVRRWPGTLGPALVHDGPLPPAASPRERVHALLQSGVGALLAAHLTDPAVRAAAARNDVAVLDAVRPPALAVGGRADLAVFADDGRCLATVVAGRLVHRRA
ncbi:imidazolonepropionase-like domain-containing protein [Micromonospora sp. CA-248260]|uniref:imidazolonepropionase-like domain-containing protein n=1 Tax=Micromonospora sp. CA-248260 TaxID=3239962 RepID=UPI003D8E2CFE